MCIDLTLYRAKNNLRRKNFKISPSGKKRSQTTSLMALLPCWFCPAYSECLTICPRTATAGSGQRRSSLLRWKCYHQTELFISIRKKYTGMFLLCLIQNTSPLDFLSAALKCYNTFNPEIGPGLSTLFGL